MIDYPILSPEYPPPPITPQPGAPAKLQFKRRDIIAEIFEHEFIFPNDFPL